MGRNDLEDRLATPPTRSNRPQPTARTRLNITELLVTGYSGDKALFAAALTPDEAKVVLTSTDDEGRTVVDSTSEQAVNGFTEVRNLMECIVGAAAPTC